MNIIMKLKDIENVEYNENIIKSKDKKNARLIKKNSEKSKRIKELEEELRKCNKWIDASFYWKRS